MPKLFVKSRLCCIVFRVYIAPAGLLGVITECSRKCTHRANQIIIPEGESQRGCWVSEWLP